LRARRLGAIAMPSSGGDVAGRIIDGKAIAAQVRAEVKAVVDARVQRGARRPGLATVLVGDDPASHVYVRNKRKQAGEAGIESMHHELPAATTEIELLTLVRRLNDDDRVDGILVQLPLPKHVDERKVLVAIDPAKDVDGFHPENVARLVLGMPGFVPCTPLGCMRILQEQGLALRGKHAVVVGRSHVVGKPMAQLLLAADATVTICHSRTADLAAITRQGDVVVAAVGRLHLLGADHVKDGAIVIDVGMNKKPDGKLAGDVDTDAAIARGAAVTPVPGGVGPMTIAMLLKNTADAHARRTGLA
jgi:methylenetetrahydrofolate dehydrogenase (NADP+) / methenyltetrahydrofolate cyclohydrolase